MASGASTHVNRLQPSAFRRETNIRALNIGDGERWASLLAGGALTLYGLSRRSLGGLALSLLGCDLVYRGTTGHSKLYTALGLSTAEGVKVEHSMTVLRSPEELYRFWRNFDNLPRIMRHLESIRQTGPNLYHWTAQGPLGSRFEWDAEIITERENELIGWRSVAGSELDTTGSVHFVKAPGERGTEVRVVLKYNPPAGKAGAAVAALFGQSPEGQIREDLRRFKQVMETGTVPTTEGQPRGRCG
jgi:uncharacterized membrane protein